MASTDRPTLPATGTVASRVQTFQNAAALGHSTMPSRMLRVMTRAQEAGTTVGHGRRMDSSFGSPAGRASRDGNEGLRGDGRPPVGTPARTIHSSMEKEIALRPARLMVQRPATSLDTTAGKMTESDGGIPRPRLLRKPRSLENVAPPTSAGNEISETRARLRTVKRPVPSYPTSTKERKLRSDTAGHKIKPSQDSADSQAILGELDGLLVSALERVKTATSEEVVANADNPIAWVATDRAKTPPPLPCHQAKERSSLASGQPLLYSKSCPRMSMTQEFLALDNTTDNDAVCCAEMPADSRSAALKLEEEEEEEEEEEQDHRLMPTGQQKGPSPVKARAAMFERMHYHIPGEYIQYRQNRDDTITTSSARSIRRRLEAENGAPRVVHSPPIELVLPQLISHPRRHTQPGSAADQSDSSQYDPGKQSLVTSPSRHPPEHEGKTPIAWPFKWNLFPRDKASPAPPKPSGVEAKAETGHDERLADSSMKHTTNHTDVSPAKRVLSPRRLPSQTRLRGAAATRTAGTEELNVVEERAKSFMEARTAKTPVVEHFDEHPSEADPKETETPKKRTDLVSTQLMTPTKSVTPRLKPSTTISSPRTSFRGRTRSGDKDSYALEQRYSLSRSRSRGGVKILVEVRSPNRSPERTKDDTIVIIRANVEPLEE